ncbi:MAG: lysozyme [Patescibacteria group bacterium]|nr:lysozyme [Patescibacteria group bacterium]
MGRALYRGVALNQMPDLFLAAREVSLFEGFRDKPYLDSASIPTIGFGCTRYPNGKAVTMDDPPITVNYALDCLAHDLSEAAKGVWAALRLQPTLNQFSAMTSLAYNIGVGAFTSSSVCRYFNQGHVDEAANHFLDWDKAHVDGQLVEVAGLHNRRVAERTLFLTPDTTVSAH